MVKEIITFGDIEIEKGVIHKGCPHKCGNFWEFNSTILSLCFPVTYGYYNFFQQS